MSNDMDIEKEKATISQMEKRYPEIRDSLRTSYGIPLVDAFDYLQAKAKLEGYESRKAEESQEVRALKVERDEIQRHLSECQRFLCEDGAKIERLQDERDEARGHIDTLMWAIRSRNKGMAIMNLDHEISRIMAFLERTAPFEKGEVE